MDFEGRRSRKLVAACGGLCGRGPAPVETFTRSQLAAISSIFTDFYDFHRFSEDFMDFKGPRVGGQEKLWGPLQTESCSFRNLYSIPAGCYFIDFH